MIFIDLMFLERTDRLGSFCRRVFSFGKSLLLGGLTGPFSGNHFNLDYCTRSFSEFGSGYKGRGLPWQPPMLRGSVLPGPLVQEKSFKASEGFYFFLLLPPRIRVGPLIAVFLRTLVHQLTL